MRRRHNGVKAHVVGEADAVDRRVDIASREQGGERRGEADAALGLGQIERLDAETVAGEHHAARVALLDGEREHALEAVDAPRPPGVPGLEDDLGVAGREEAVALGLEFGAQLGIVVDAAVERDREAEFAVAHRLRGLLREVDDLQPSVAEAGAVADQHATAVGAAGDHHPHHGRDGFGRGFAAIEAEIAADAAHGSMFP